MEYRTQEQFDEIQDSVICVGVKIKIAESLYCWNKTAKEYRDRIEYLKDVLFGMEWYEIDTRKLKSTPSDWLDNNLCTALDDLLSICREIENGIDYEPEYDNILNQKEREKAKREKWVYSYYFEEFIPEDEFNEEVKKIHKDIETLEDLLSSLHDELHMLSKEKARIYAIKDKLIRKYGTYKETHMVGYDIRQYDLYHLCGFEFHIIREEDDIDKTKKIGIIPAKKTKNAICHFTLEELEEMI